MAIFNLFSKRQRMARGEFPDVFQYEHIPQELRVQVTHIFNDVAGGNLEFVNYPPVAEAYTWIVKTLCKEYGVFFLPGSSRHDNALTQFMNFILKEENTESVLDAIELGCLVIDSVSRKSHYRHNYQTADADATQGLAELNERFKQRGVGYRYEDGKFIRIDSELVHAEVVKPALTLLHDPRFVGAQAEFLKAHEHYRHGRYKESLTECLKSLESTMKTIADAQGWKVSAKATSSALVSVMFDNGLVPSFWQTHFTGIRTMLEAGVPTVRNNLGGHGQGGQVVTVPEHIVAYALHQTAATLVFLLQAEKALP